MLCEVTQGSIFLSYKPRTIVYLFLRERFVDEVIRYMSTFQTLWLPGRCEAGGRLVDLQFTAGRRYSFGPVSGEGLESNGPGITWRVSLLCWIFLQLGYHLACLTSQAEQIVQKCQTSSSWPLPWNLVQERLYVEPMYFPEHWNGKLGEILHLTLIKGFFVS